MIRQNPISAFIRMSVVPENFAELHALARAIEEVRECHHVSGEDSYMLRVHAASVADLEKVIQRLSAHGTTVTSIVLASPVVKRNS